MSGADVMEIAAKSVRALRYAERGAAVGPAVDAEDRAIATDLLAALHAAGWRIVRTFPQRSHGLIEYDEIGEEWTPEIRDAARVVGGHHRAATAQGEGTQAGASTPVSGPPAPGSAEEKLVVLMEALDESLKAAKAARDRLRDAHPDCDSPESTP